MSTQRGHHWLDREDQGGLTVVRFRVSRLKGADDCREVFGMLHGLIDEAGRCRLVLDLGQVEALDSYALGKLVMLNRKARAAGGRLVLCRLGQGPQADLAAMRLSGVFEVYDGEKEAIQSFEALPPSGSPTAGGTNEGRETGG